MFKKLSKWIDEKLHGKDRRITELEKKVKTLENVVLSNRYIYSSYDKVVSLMTDNTRTIHYLLSKNHKVTLDPEYIDSFKPPVLRIVSKD